MSTTPVTLRTAREETIDALCRGFARDALSMGELERRLARAREARTRDELQALLSDLAAPRPAPPVPAGEGSTPASGRSRAPARSGSRPGAGGTEADGGARTSGSAVLAVLGGTRRAGRWAPPSSMVAVAIMGGVELDFRDAVLQPGTTVDINCFAFWGGIDITVPPDVHVDSHGFALLGGFDQKADLESDPAPGAPVIRINGLAVMGGVDVKVKARSPR